MTLLPGESFTFAVSGLGSASASAVDALLAPPVLRCVNDRL